MQLDRQVAAVLEKVAASPLPMYWDVDPPAARKLFRESRAAVSPPVPEVGSVEDLTMPGPASELRLRHYRPAGADETLPVFVFYHGGGWVIGDLDTHDIACRTYANAAKCAVVAVDYRLAPEHRFPAAADDAVAAVHWVHANATRLRVDPTRIAVGGDSAGGNLAAVVAIALRDTWGPALRLQVLMYPVTDMRMDTGSYVRNAEGYLLTRKSMEWFRDHYLRGPADVTDWRVSPLLAADHSRLPPAYIVTAGFDPLHDEGEAYARKLEAAGVPVTYECFEGMIHGFVGMGGVIATAGHALARAGQQLRQAFAA